MDTVIEGRELTGINPLRRRAFRPAKFHDKEVPERKWIVNGLIPAGTVTMLAGDGGLGKSLLAMMLQVACATGGMWCGSQAAQIRSVAMYGEDENDEIQRRLVDIIKHYNCEFSDPRLDDMQWNSVVGQECSLVEYISVIERDTGERRNLWRTTPTYGDVLDWAVEEGAQLIILDSLHDYFHGNENDRAQVRFFVSQLRVLAQEIDGAVVILSHPSVAGMASGSGSSGSTAWNNAVRSRLYLTRPDADDGPPDNDIRILKTMKSNYGKIGGKIDLRWEEGVFVVEDQGGMVHSIERRNVEKGLLEGLRILQQQGRGTSDSSRAGNFAPRILKTLSCCRPYSTRDLERAMMDLLAEGRIAKSQIGIDGARRPILGLTETECSSVPHGTL